jgi:hypothetical protein
MESVSLRVARSDGTGADAVDTILARGVELSDTVLSSALDKDLRTVMQIFSHPVYGRLIVLHVVVDRNAEGIAPCCPNCWARILPIDEEAHLVAASALVACAVGDI